MFGQLQAGEKLHGRVAVVSDEDGIRLLIEVSDDEGTVRGALAIPMTRDEAEDTGDKLSWFGRGGF